jgi:hypothetical protein
MTREGVAMHYYPREVIRKIARFGAAKNIEHAFSAATRYTLGKCRERNSAGMIDFLAHELLGQFCCCGDRSRESRAMMFIRSSIS